MLILEWNNPKITVSDLDFFLNNYLGAIYNGIVIQDTKLSIYTNEPMTSEQEDYIIDWYYTLNGMAQKVQIESSLASLNVINVNEKPQEVQPISDLTCDWPSIKMFYAANSSSSMHYFEKADSYYIWIEYRDQKFYIPSLAKGTADATEFETTYKAKCNIKEAPKVRLTTCKIGRKLHDRYVAFVTADQGNFDNTDFNNVSYGDFTYRMFKWVNNARVLTTVNSEAEETWLDFEPLWDYEVSSGSIDVPEVLAGENQNAWEVHVIAVPDLPKAYGGTVELIANPRLKFKKGKVVATDSSMNPAELTYNAAYHTNKIRFVVMHPAGAQSEFQLNLKLYK